MKPADKIKELINKSNVQTNSLTNNKILGDALEYLEKLTIIEIQKYENG